MGFRKDNRSIPSDNGAKQLFRAAKEIERTAVPDDGWGIRGITNWINADYISRNMDSHKRAKGTQPKHTGV